MDFGIINWKEVVHMAHMAICIPVSVVTAVLAFFYGKSVRHGWLSALITFVCSMLGGLLYAGIGQIIGVVLSALIIAVFFTLPEHKRLAQEEAAREKAAENLPNEEDL